MSTAIPVIIPLQPYTNWYNANMKDSIFTKIINGETFCHKVFEDEHTFAFLDIHPVNAGHTLVIPKQQVEFVWDLDPQAYQALMHTAKSVALRLREVLDVPYVGEKIIGVDVPHAHVHLIPFTTSSEFKHDPDMQKEPDHTALARMAETLAFS